MKIVTASGVVYYTYKNNCKPIFNLESYKLLKRLILQIVEGYRFKIGDTTELSNIQDNIIYCVQHELGSMYGMPWR